MGAGLGAFGFAAGVTAFLKAAMGSGMEAFATAGTGAALAGAVAFAGAAATTLRAGAATRGLFVAPSAAATIGFFSSVMLSLGLAIPATDGTVTFKPPVLESASVAYRVVLDLDP